MVLLLALLASSDFLGMVRAGVETGPNTGVYVNDGYYADDYGWYGPGMYYGVYYSDYPSYYAWRRRYYYGGPYYYRYRYHDGNYHGHNHGGRHHGGGGHH